MNDNGNSVIIIATIVSEEDSSKVSLPPGSTVQVRKLLAQYHIGIFQHFQPYVEAQGH